MSMMRIIRLAETQIDRNGLQQFLKELGAPDWKSHEPKSAGEELIEIAGRLCYKSFGLELNANLTRIREGNHEYIGNVLRQKHGSVIEHATVTYAFLNVSRILTHELVRHRPGIAFSQESQRFVRLDKIEVYIPNVTETLKQIVPIIAPNETKEWQEEWVTVATMKYLDTVEENRRATRNLIDQLVTVWQLNEPGIPFGAKKKLTSALRRLAPSGINTHIIVTANHRTWRHLIEMRSAPGAEDEIIEAFGLVAENMKDWYPALYQDMQVYRVTSDQYNHYRFENQKV